MTTNKTTTTEGDLQKQVDDLKVVVEGLKNNVNVLDANLQKIYAAYNNLVGARKQQNAAQPGGWL